MTKWILALMIIVFIISGCNKSIDNNDYDVQINNNAEDDSTVLVEVNDVEVNDNSDDTTNERVEDSEMETHNIKNVFPQNVGFVWYYEGPNDSEKISVIDRVEDLEESVIVTILNCRKDLTGEEELENRLSQNIIEITEEKIIIDKSVVLSTPLRVGNSWETIYRIKPAGEEYTAIIEIIGIKDDEIITKVVVSYVNNPIEESYQETVKYKIGVGIISEWYNILGMDGYMRGLDLKHTYEKPEFPDKWYLTPYQIERQKRD